MSAPSNLTDDKIVSRASRFWTSLFEQEALATNLEQLIANERTYQLAHFGSLKLSVARASNRGDGFLSDTYALTAKLDSGETFTTFVKVLPTNPFMRSPAISQRVFNKEEAVYKELHAGFRRLRAEAGLSSLDIPLNVPRLYYAKVQEGVREDGAGNDYVAVVALENLKVQGFSMIDKHAGCNLKEAQASLYTFANFHALSIAQLRKWKQSDEYVLTKSLQFIHKRTGLDDVMPTIVEAWLPIFGTVLRQLNQSEVASWIEDQIVDVKKVMAPEDIYQCGPLSAIIHADCWTNNMMYRTDADGTAHMRLIDWQNPMLGNAITDYLHFLFTSTTTDLRVQYFDQFMGDYFKTLNSALAKLGIYLDQEGYTVEEFRQDIRKRLRSALFAALVILPYILDQGIANNASDYTQDDVERLASDKTGQDNLTEMKAKFTNAISAESILANQELCHRIVQVILEVKTALQK